MQIYAADDGGDGGGDAKAASAAMEIGLGAGGEVVIDSVPVDRPAAGEGESRNITARRDNRF